MSERTEETKHEAKKALIEGIPSLSGPEAQKIVDTFTAIVDARLHDLNVIEKK